MIAQEYVGYLLVLNESERQLRRAGLDAGKRKELEERVVEVKGRLPTALVTHHERMAKAGRESVAALSGSSSCGGCHMKLPVGMLADLNKPGRISVCPYCGSFVFKVAPAVSAPG
jgi:predicted  nucleic acid-binding Zn-ribbon protein